MDTDKDDLSVKEQLDLITGIVQDSRNAVKHNAFPFMLWGITVPLMYGITYILISAKLFAGISWVWTIGSLLSTAAVIIYYAKHRSKKISYPSSRIQILLWNSIFAGWLGLTGVGILGRTGFEFSESLAVLAVLLGIGFIVMFALTKYRLVFICGILWMILGLVCLYAGSDIAPFLMAAASVFLNFIPGLIILKKEKSYTVYE